MRLTRREVLKTTVGASCAASVHALKGSIVLGATNQRMPRVLVIGAGFGGLACAFELAQVGYPVQVLEARDRVGGRIQSLLDYIPNKVVEAGGELLGSNHPQILRYAAMFGLDFLDVTEETESPAVVALGNRLLNAAEIESAFQEIDDALESLNGLAREINEDEPWLSANAEQLDRQSIADWIQDQDMSPFAKALLEVDLVGTNGVATSSQSLLGILTVIKGGGLERYWTDSEVYRLKGGNQQIAIRLADALGPERVHLNCAVTKIERHDQGATVWTSTGQQFDADEVVLAIPPSIWKTIDFTPALPDTLSVQFGDNVKYLMSVKGPFWQDLNLAPDATTDAAFTQIWHGTDGQPSGGPEALIGFTGGPQARALHNLDEETRRETYRSALEILYPGSRSQHVRDRFVDWIGDPWTRGGYSFPAPGEIMSVGPVLYQGLSRLHFAGEHACYKFVGYAEGALNSGVRIARKIASRNPNS